jgi:predicted pyridoxine 5'-phosphate oxidase superfamily flavin-nucleotide-binding protein
MSDQELSDQAPSDQALREPRPAYHAGQRRLQSHFASTQLADRLVEKLERKQFTEDDKRFVESASFFFIASADAEGRPDCSFKGGLPGFVRVVRPDCMVFPDYDGNGMFRTLGNIGVNPQVGLLFIALGERPRRLRVNGRAEVAFDDAALGEYPGAQLLVRVIPERIFPNCPRYIPNLATGEPSMYAPCAGAEAVEPAWKSFDDFKDVVPPRRA